MLARAAALGRSLRDRNPAEDAVPRLAVGGDCQPTPVRALTEHGKLRFLTSRDVNDPLFDQVTEPGDGIVTAESAFGLPASSTLTTLTTCSRHNAYLLDADTRDRAVRFLLQ